MSNTLPTKATLHQMYLQGAQTMRAKAAATATEEEQVKIAILEAEAERIIKEASEKILIAVNRGEPDYTIGYLRFGVHMSRNENPLDSIIGKILRERFKESGLKITFETWGDPERLGELDEGSGYKVIIGGWAN